MSTLYGWERYGVTVTAVKEDVLGQRRLDRDNSTETKLYSQYGDRYRNYFSYSAGAAAYVRENGPIYTCEQIAGGWFWFKHILEGGSVRAYYVSQQTVEKKEINTSQSYGAVTSTSRSAYPDNGVSGSYWYVYEGIQNRPPVISGSNLDLGAKVEDFVIPYNVTDPDGNAVTVSITLDGASKVSGQSVVLGRNYDFLVAIGDLTLGTHKVVITATDGIETATRTYTFTKTNIAPVIDGQDEDIGGKSTAFSVDYYITDENGDPVTATVLLDEEIIQTITGAQDKQQTVTITTEMLAAFEVGSEHRITIQADDGKGGRAYRYYTFTKTNRPPIISGSNADLGELAEPPSIEYSVTDAEQDEITVELLLNGNVVQEAAVVEDNEVYTYAIAHDLWIKLPYGQHTFTVRAWDGNSAGNPTTRLYTLTRIAGGLEVVVKVNEFDVQPSKIIAVPHGMFADDADVQVFVCNNFLDDAPTWEDASEMSRIARAYAFTNTTKTAEKWSIGIKIIIENGESGVSSVLRGIKGGYE